jgi:hypothetical protein
MKQVKKPAICTAFPLMFYFPKAIAVTGLFLQTHKRFFDKYSHFNGTERHQLTQCLQTTYATVLILIFVIPNTGALQPKAFICKRQVAPTSGGKGSMFTKEKETQ